MDSRDKYPLTRRMTVRPELCGVEALMNPFIQHTSSQRMSMYASHLGQPLVLEQAKPPRIASGFEPLVGKYAFDKLYLETDIRICANIPRYSPALSTGENTDVLVIYVDGKNTIHYFLLTPYNNAHKFGYRNIWIDPAFRRPGTIIPKGEFVYSRAENQDGDMWNPGVDAETMYTSEFGTVEDAIIISKAYQQRLVHTDVTELTINLRENQIPFNLYGDENTYRIMPDINRTVRPDGLLFCVRNINLKDPNLTDLQDVALINPNIYDDSWEAPLGAKIISIEIHRAKAAKPLVSEAIYEQPFEYYENGARYYQRILEEYINLSMEGFKPSPAFSTLVEDALRELIVANTNTSIRFPKTNDRRFAKITSLIQTMGRKHLNIVDGKDTIEFMQIKIRYACRVVPGVGFKLTGRYGDKGVISAIWETEDMPTNIVTGKRADLLAAEKGGFGRMNIGQFDEQGFNAMSDVVRDKMLQCGDNKMAYQMLLEYLNDIYPEYADLVKQTYHTPTQIEELLAEIEEDGITLVLLPFLDANYEEILDKLKTKWGSPKGKVQFTVHTRNGPKTITSVEDHLIGKKYHLALYKDPRHQMYGVSTAHISQIQVPIVPNKYLKAMVLVKSTPIRLGEDECSLLMMSLGAAPTARAMGIMSGTPDAAKEMAERLLTDPYPSRIDRLTSSNQEILAKSSRLNMIHHQFGVLGITFRPDLDDIPELEENFDDDNQ